MFFRTEKSIKEFRERYPIVFSIIIINLTLWLLVYIVPFSFGRELFFWGAGHNLSISEYNEYWRFVTPIFLHGGFMHVILNSFALVLFGPGLEIMLGKVKFLLLFILAGVIGNVGTYIIDPLSTITHIGASGSIYGLFGVYLFIVLFRKYLISGQDAQIVTTIFIIGLVMTFIRPGINISAHVFGFIGGFMLAPLVLSHLKSYRNW